MFSLCGSGIENPWRPHAHVCFQNAHLLSPFPYCFREKKTILLPARQLGRLCNPFRVEKIKASKLERRWWNKGKKLVNPKSGEEAIREESGKPRWRKWLRFAKTVGCKVNTTKQKNPNLPKPELLCLLFPICKTWSLIGFVFPSRQFIFMLQLQTERGNRKTMRNPGVRSHGFTIRSSHV